MYLWISKERPSKKNHQCLKWKEADLSPGSQVPLGLRSRAPRLVPAKKIVLSGERSTFLAAFVDIPCAVGFSTPVVKERQLQKHFVCWEFILINGAINLRYFVRNTPNTWKVSQSKGKALFSSSLATPSANYWKLQFFITFAKMVGRQKSQKTNMCKKESQWFQVARARSIFMVMTKVLGSELCTQS